MFFELKAKSGGLEALSFQFMCICFFKNSLPS